MNGVGMYGMVKMKNPFKAFDDYFMDAINKKLKSRAGDVFFYHYTHIAGPKFLVVLSVVMLVFGKRWIGHAAHESVLALVISTIVAQILKRAVSRSRPYWVTKNLNTYGIDLRDYSFPSGHTTAAFTVATTFSLYFPKLAAIFIILALLVAISRTYLAVHYPTDVLAGMIIGVVVGYVVHIYVYGAVAKWF
ncbi:MAG: phosphatase PAP2 family protein [Peptoniphilus sp.]|nr:phosphatase PAP2 family protein [Peptoniphilus sp.]MDD7362824.1 phosphatase PAP2 family protein [Bacillota bacterium]MDY6043984.1 phosphatase PAP2 family protein [Peptoniphilus sp.]